VAASYQPDQGSTRIALESADLELATRELDAGFEKGLRTGIRFPLITGHMVQAQPRMSGSL